MRKFSLLLGLVAATALSQITTSVAAERNTAQVIPTAGTLIQIDLSKGKLIRLPRAASAVFVADTRIADVNVRSPRLIYLFGKAPGETTLYAVDTRDQVVVAQRVIIAPNVDRIRDLYRQLRPNAPVRVEAVGDQIVITGQVTSVDVANEFVRVAEAAVGDPKKVVNRMLVSAPNQVNIRVKIAEVSRDINKAIGFNWELIGEATADWALGFAVGSDIVRDDLTGAFIFPADPTDRIVSTVRTDSFAADTVIDLLDDEGLITVLAEPNLTAMSGEKAAFLVGGEFPIPVAQDEGTTTIQFRQFGVALSFTPTILGQNRINLKVRPEVSQLSSAGAIQANGFNIPSLTTRKVETTVEMGSGQTFVLAGLLQNSTNHNLSDVPGLKEVPILGALFRSDAFRRQETELMVIVTPFIVRPTTARIPLPPDNYVPPKDLERFLLGRNHVGQPAAKRSAPLDRNGKPGLAGPAGFVLQ
ncbi:MAG: type II and III secretion system protein family protein [Alphaproteobacteria bacterium]|nr:type II and III secretion system protein family protein [Alphaproteobacteria bacterium]